MPKVKDKEVLRTFIDEYMYMNDDDLEEFKNLPSRMQEMFKHLAFAARAHLEEMDNVK